MAYSQELDDDISILSMSQIRDCNEYKAEVSETEKESYPGSVYALQLAFQKVRERCDRVEEKNVKHQQTKNRLITELNELKQTKTKWIKEIIEKDVTCNQLRQKLGSLSQEVVRLGDKVKKIGNEKDCLEKNVGELKTENELLKNAFLHSKHGDNHLKDSNMKQTESWQELSQKLLMKMKQEMDDIDDYSRMLASPCHSAEKMASEQDEYHSHHKRPEAPCPCVLAPCAVVIDNDSSIDTMIGECSDIKDELSSHTEALRSSMTALKTLVKNKDRRQLSGNDPNSEDEQNFMSNVATFNSVINHTAVSLQPEEGTDVLPGRPRRSSSEMEASCDRTCPICEAVYPLDIPFTEFEGHVLKHFDSEGDEITQNFEFI